MSPRILVVEDEAAMRQMVAMLLRGRGYDVSQAASGAEALRAIRHSPPDLVLLDVMMPEMDGYEVARLIRADPATAILPIVILTAKVHSANRAEALQAGADDFLTKPVDPAVLLERVAAALTRAESRREPTDPLARALEALPELLRVSIAWVLAVDADARQLRSAAAASAAGTEAAEAFLQAIRGGPGVLTLPLAPDISPLADAALGGDGWLDKPPAWFAQRPGGDSIRRGLQAAGVSFASIVPLPGPGPAVGVLLLAGDSGRVAPRLAAWAAGLVALALENRNLSAELERRESDRHRAQEFYKSLLNTMGDGLVMLDDAGRVQYVNRRLLLMLGYSEGQLIGRDLEELVHPMDRPAIRALIGRRGAKRVTASLEKHVLRADGTNLPVLSVFVPGGSGGVGNVWVITDLSEQKAREQALERRNAQLATINQAARVMASSLDLDAVPRTILEKSVEALEAQGGSILLLEEASGDLVFQAAIGPETARLPGMHVPVGRGIGGWVAEHGRPALVEDASADERFYGDIDRATGLRTTSLIAAPLIVQRRIIGVLELVNKRQGAFDRDDLALLETLAQSSAVAIANARLVRDLHLRAGELEQAYEDLKAADLLKDELVQNVSHELRTPLTFILGYVELMLGGELGALTDQQRQSLEVVRRKCRALTKVVSDIVTLQRLTLASLQRRPASLRELVDQAVKGCRLAAGQAGLNVISQLAAAPPVELDEERVSQVLDNLLGNAIKFSPRGGAIHVRLEDVGHALRVEVADSGIGIPPDKLNKVFGRFFQVDGSATRRYGGVGLGLAICKDIIEAHGGRIWVESAPGHGSSFFFTLPKNGA